MGQSADGNLFYGVPLETNDNNEDFPDWTTPLSELPKGFDDKQLREVGLDTYMCGITDGDYNLALGIKESNLGFSWEGFTMVKWGQLEDKPEWKLTIQQMLDKMGVKTIHPIGWYIGCNYG